MWVGLWVANFKPSFHKSFGMMAGSTGLEPAASAVTGQRSNQLNYDPALRGCCPAQGRVTWFISSPGDGRGGQCRTRTCDLLLVRQAVGNRSTISLQTRYCSGFRENNLISDAFRAVAFWWAVQGSNLRPSGCKPDALTN